MEKRKIAIIGAGISGLIAAKVSLEANFDVLIFDKSSELGGNWSTKGKVWSSLQTNISKYYTQLMNYVWNDTDNIFPSKSEMHNYIKNFCEDFQITPLIKFNTKIISVIQVNNDSQIKLITDKDEEFLFDFLIVSSGLYENPNMLNLSSTEYVKVIHANDYKSPSEFKNKRVMVVGMGPSAVEIASEVSKCASKVFSVFRKPAWVNKKWKYSDQYNKYLPYDIGSFNIKNIEMVNQIKDEKQMNKIRNFMSSQSSEQNEISKDLYIDPESEQPPFQAISDHYINHIKKGLIIPLRAEIKSISEDKVTLSTGRQEEIDVVILCTGYFANLSFLGQKVLQTIDYKQDNILSPFILNFHVCHPNLKNIAFVGLSKGQLVTFVEMQALLAIKHFQTPNKIKVNTIEKFRQKREDKIFRSQYLHNPFSYLYQISKELEMYPNLELIKEHDSELHDYILNGPLLPQHFCLNRFPSKEVDPYVEYIKKINKDLRRSQILSAKF
jgi:dimethylaniline monooxygenase (N-oxide forming)